jgi:propionyl-CoA synthetase
MAYDLKLWEDAAGDIFWYQAPTVVLDDGNPPFYRWYPDGITNACYNALDIHVQQGRGEQLAVIYDSPITGSKSQLTYTELLDSVSRLAGVLAEHGVGKGDRILIYMPMVFGGFASNELAVRIDDATPKIVLSASCGVEPTRIVPYKPLLDQAIAMARHKPQHCIILQRPQEIAELNAPRDLDWEQVSQDAVPADCVPVAANDPLYILYTSGTTGQPKGVVRDTGGSIVALKWSMSRIYDIEPGDVYWAASDIGWVVGHSYIVYGPLFNGSTTLIYEGKPVGTPDPGAFWRVISEYGVKSLFTAPTAFRAIKKEDPTGQFITKYDLSSLQSLFLAGERCDPDTLNWASDKLAVPVIDHWWQTETGWSICCNCLGDCARLSCPARAGLSGRGLRRRRQSP